MTETIINSQLRFSLSFSLSLSLSPDIGNLDFITSLTVLIRARIHCSLHAVNLHPRIRGHVRACRISRRSVIPKIIPDTSGSFEFIGSRSGTPAFTGIMTDASPSRSKVMTLVAREGSRDFVKPETTRSADGITRARRRDLVFVRESPQSAIRCDLWRNASSKRRRRTAKLDPRYANRLRADGNRGFPTLCELGDCSFLQIIARSCR